MAQNEFNGPVHHHYHGDVYVQNIVGLPRELIVEMTEMVRADTARKKQEHRQRLGIPADQALLVCRECGRREVVHRNAYTVINGYALCRGCNHPTADVY